jgi:hypothetical protein
MADSTPPAGGPSKPTDKKETVRITLPPRPMQTPPPAGAAANAAKAPPGTVPAIPVPQKKETSRLKKTTGKVPGPTKPAMPVVPPPTIRAQPVPQPPSTVATTPPPQPPATVSAPPSKADASAARPTVRLEAANIPSRPVPASQQMPAPMSELPKTVLAPPPAAAPVAAGGGGPTWLDAVLGLLVMAVSGVVAFLLWQTSNIQ